jgi:hypothetical protein
MSRFIEGSPEHAAQRFVDALAWGKHRVVWLMFSANGRQRIVEIGMAAGLDRVLADRIANGSAETSEMEEFLSSLMHGLRADFENLSSDKLIVEPTDLVTETSALVNVVTPGFIPMHRWPIGQFQMVKRDAEWYVESFKPHRTLS